MSGIQTSTITTATDANLELDPAGTGKIVLTNEVGSGETPLSTDNEGVLHELNTNNLAELPTDTTVGDLVMIQRNGVQYKVDASDLGTGNANPFPIDVTAVPPFENANDPDAGTQANPFRCTPITVNTPGGSGETLQLITIANQKPAALGTFDDQSVGTGARFTQPVAVFDLSGSWTGRLQYLDKPDSTAGQVYAGELKMGSATVYFVWDVTQVANQTQFTPIASPNASPASVNYALDAKYGTVTGTYIDAVGALSATGPARFSINGGAAVTTGNVAYGDTLGVMFDAPLVDAAAQGDTVSGIISGQSGFLLVPSITINRNADAFTPSAQTSQPTSAAVTSANVPITGINCKSYVTLGTATLTSVEASVNGAAYAAIPASGTAMPMNPGDTLTLKGTTGGTANTAYTAEVKVGTTVGTWSVTTSAAQAAVAQPTITAPVSGSTGLGPDVDLVGSAYTAINGAGAHGSSDWQVYQADMGPLSSDIITSVGQGSSFGAITYANSANSNSVQNAFDGGVTQYDAPWVISTQSAAGGATYQRVELINPVVNTTGYVVVWSFNGVAGNQTQVLWVNGVPINFTATTQYVNPYLVPVPTGPISNIGLGFPGSANANAYGFDLNATSTGSAVPLVLPSTTEVLTLSSNASLSQFSSGMNVTESSGGTPITSSITNVQNNLGAWNSASSVTGWYDVAYGPGAVANKFVIVGENTGGDVLYSNADGTSYTQIAPGGYPNTGLDATQWRGVTYGGASGAEQFVACGRHPQGGGSIMTSPDGISWTGQVTSSQLHTTWVSVAYGNGKYVSVGAGTVQLGTTGSVMYSTTAASNSWTLLNIYASVAWSDVEYGGASGQEKFVAVGSAAPIYSTDGINWSQATISSSPLVGYTFQSVAYGNGIWVAVNAAGQYMTSTTGQLWTGATMAGPAAGYQWWDVTYGDGKFVAVAWGGADRIATSTNGIDWTVVGTGSGAQYYGVGYGGPSGQEKFISVALAGNPGVAWSFTGTGVNETTLNFTNDTNLANFRPGDGVMETGGNGQGLLQTIGTNSMVLGSVSGTWSTGTTLYKTAAVPAASGVVSSTNTATNTLTLSSSSGRWLVTESGYDTAAKLNKTVTNPSVPGSPPGAPTTSPPDAAVYTTVVNVAADTTNKTTYPLTDTQLDPDKAYYSRTRYNSSDGTPVVSPYSNYNEFVTTDSFVPLPGEAIEGGYFAGQIVDGGNLYNIIVCPKAYDSGAMAFSTTGSFMPGITSTFFGGPATTLYMNNITTDANNCWSMFSASSGSAPYRPNGSQSYSPTQNTPVYDGEGGYADWYLPATNELELAYRYLKPSSTANNTNYGANPNARPSTSNYAQYSPTQTTSTVFQSPGGSQYFENFQNAIFYWTGTSNGGGTMPSISFASGVVTQGNVANNNNTRGVRRVLVGPA